MLARGECAYAHTDLAEKAGRSRLISFLDIDGTLSSYSDHPPDAELEARREIREILETYGGYVLTTARTPELCMSEGALAASRKAGFSRLEPKCSTENGRRVCRPLSTMRKYAHLADPDAIHSIGEGIWIRRNGAYYPDKEYYARYKVEREHWKRSVRLLLEYVDADNLIRGGFSHLEEPDNYKNGLADVQEVECRFEITAKPGVDGCEWKKLVRERIRRYRACTKEASLARIARSIEFIDESNPVKGRYQLYLVPHKRLTKEGAFNHVLRRVAHATGIPTEEFTTLSAGDRMPDLRAGLFGGNRGFFILAGGSVLTDYLVGSKRGQDFAGQSLAAIVRRLIPVEGRKGWYLFYMFGMTHPRVVIIADEAVKGGKTDAESVLEVVKQINGDLVPG